MKETLELKRIESLRDEVESVVNQALESAGGCSDLGELERIRARYLGRKGQLTQFLRSLGSLPQEARPGAGKLVNDARIRLETALDERESELKQAEKQQHLNEKIDITLPGRKPVRGGRHPLTLVIDEITTVFVGLGFEVAYGPEVELDYFNFEALNIPKNHPARDMQDSFYISDDTLLRTHTSPVQVRTMSRRKPPVRVIAPGKVYRSDQADATHSPMFHQIEGFAVGSGITFGDLKGTLTVFAKELFGQERGVRFRPSYFPFTEPSAEVDISCIICGGDGCRVCSRTGWLEILGAGMIHPKVLEAVGYDPEKVSGFAFGMGVERIAMLKYGIDDIRLFFENDLRFLEQFQ